MEQDIPEELLASLEVRLDRMLRRERGMAACWAEHDDSIKPDGKVFRLVSQSAMNARREQNTTQRPSYLATVYSLEEAELLSALRNAGPAMVRELQRRRESDKRLRGRLSEMFRATADALTKVSNHLKRSA